MPTVSSPSTLSLLNKRRAESESDEERVVGRSLSSLLRAFVESFSEGSLAEEEV